MKPWEIVTGCTYAMAEGDPCKVTAVMPTTRDGRPPTLHYRVAGDPADRIVRRMTVERFAEMAAGDVNGAGCEA